MRGVIPPHLKARFELLDALALDAQPPAPWKSVGLAAVGGLTSVGFYGSCDLLLAASSSGLGVFDARTGQRLARNAGPFELDLGNLLVKGIGPLADKQVRMSGIYGGGLACQTADGWAMEVVPLSWPDEEIILSPPGQSMLWCPTDQPMKLHKLAGFVTEVRAFGFSPTGSCFVVATSADIAFFSR